MNSRNGVLQSPVWKIVYDSALSNTCWHFGNDFTFRLLGFSYQAKNNPNVGGINRGGFHSWRSKSSHGLCSTFLLLLPSLHTLLTLLQVASDKARQQQVYSLRAVQHQFLFPIPIRHFSKVLTNLHVVLFLNSSCKSSVMGLLLLRMVNQVLSPLNIILDPSVAKASTWRLSNLCVCSLVSSSKWCSNL